MSTDSNKKRFVEFASERMADIIEMAEDLGLGDKVVLCSLIGTVSEDENSPTGAVINGMYSVLVNSPEELEAVLNTLHDSYYSHDNDKGLFGDLFLN